MLNYQHCCALYAIEDVFHVFRAESTRCVAGRGGRASDVSALVYVLYILLCLVGCFILRRCPLFVRFLLPFFFHGECRDTRRTRLDRRRIIRYSIRGMYIQTIYILRTKYTPKYRYDAIPEGCVKKCIIWLEPFIFVCLFGERFTVRCFTVFIVAPLCANS